MSKRTTHILIGIAVGLLLMHLYHSKTNGPGTKSRGG